MTNNYDLVSDIYDTYNISDYDIDFYLNRYKNFFGTAVELMAGTGRLSIPLLKSEIKLDCVDISKGLLEKLSNKIMSEKLLSNIYCQDIRYLNLKDHYDLIIIAFNSFSEIVDKEDQNKVFKSIYNILTDSGEFIFTLYNPQFRRKSINNNIAFINEYSYNNEKIIFSMTSFEKNNIVKVKQFYEFYNEFGTLTNKRLLELAFRLMDKVEIENLIKDTGFKIKEFYGSFDMKEYNEKESSFMIYVLQK